MLINRLYNFKNRAKEMTYLSMRLNDFSLSLSLSSLLFNFKIQFCNDLRFRNKNAIYLCYFLDVHLLKFPLQDF